MSQLESAEPDPFRLDLKPFTPQLHVDVGLVEVGKKCSRAVIVQNGTEETMDVSVSITRALTGIHVDCREFTLSLQSFQNVNIEWLPSKVGHLSQTVLFSWGTSSSASVRLIGRAVQSSKGTRQPLLSHITNMDSPVDFVVVHSNKALIIFFRKRHPKNDLHLAQRIILVI